jgi:hypothetical protein
VSDRQDHGNQDGAQCFSKDLDFLTDFSSFRDFARSGDCG